jgi:hypothetical protein
MRIVLVPSAPTDVKPILYPHANRYNERSHHEIVIEPYVANI